MLPRISFGQIAFSHPEVLWLLVLPALLLAAWVFRFATRRADMRHLMRARVLPIREHFALAGDLPFWLCLIAAVTCCVLALARPHGPAQMVRIGGVDRRHPR